MNQITVYMSAVRAVDGVYRAEVEGRALSYYVYHIGAFDVASVFCLERNVIKRRNYGLI